MSRIGKFRDRKQMSGLYRLRVEKKWSDLLIGMDIFRKGAVMKMFQNLLWY